MTKVTQNSFLGGQLDFEMMGRQDFDRYAKGASELVNFNMLQRGGIVKRQGFDRIIDLERLGITEGRVRLVPFAYKKDKGFVLVFSRGMCHAVCTVEGRVWAAWSIPPPSGTGQFATDEEIASFDYQQCGYVLYIAHQNYRPTTISAAADDIDDAIEAGKNWDGTSSLSSPFLWKTFECTAMSEGVPYVDRFEQTRIAPTPDTAGGIVVEKYKVSAVFDDEETIPSAEAYSSENIIPVKKSCNTTVQTSTTAQYESTSVVVEGQGAGQKTKTVTPPVTTTSKTNKQMVRNANTSAYYSPWVESQVIRIVAKVRPRLAGGVYRYPDQIRFYKKDKGYYGLIGTTKVGGVVGQVEADITLPNSHHGEYWQSWDYNNENQYMKIGLAVPDEPEPGVAYQKFFTGYNGIANRKMLEFEDDYDGAATWWPTIRTTDKTTDAAYLSSMDEGIKVDTDSNVTVARNDGNKIVAKSASLRMWLGAIRTEHLWTNTYKEYYKPEKQIVILHKNGCGSVSIAGTGTYTKMDGTPAAFSATITIDGIPHVDGMDYYNEIGEYEKTYADTNLELLKNINTAKSGVADGEDQGTFDIPLKAFEDAAASLQSPGYDVRLDSVVITPASSSLGGLVFSGLSLKDEVYPDEAYFDDKYITPDASITPYEDKREGVDPFSSAKSYPACVCLSQQRLIWASSKRNPERMWMSEIGDFKVYTAHEVQKADDAIEFDLPVTRFAKLNHIVEMKSLLAFNDACEWLIDSSSSVLGMTYETVQARPQGYVGSNARLKPLICANTVLYSERTGQAVRQFAYNIQDNGFSGTDVSILAKSIFGENNIRDWTYQQFPNGVVWCVLSDGTLASFTFMPEQSIMAWGTHRHGCDNVKFEAVSTSYALSPSLAEVKDSNTSAYELATHQEVFAITKDTITGQRWLERMRVRCKAHEDSVYNALTLDSMRVVTDPVVYHPSDHPDGMMPEAAGCAYYDEAGAKYNSSRIAAAALRNDPNRVVYEGYPVYAKFTSVYPLLGGDIGTGQFDIKAITRVGLRLMGSTGGYVATKQFEDKKEPVRYNDDRDHDKTKKIVWKDGRYCVVLKDVDEANVIPYGANCRDGRVVVTQGVQWPFAILAMDTEYALETENGGAS